MKINQSKNQLYTKGLSDSESSMLLMIKRFFERNPEELYGSINNIVLEVTRKVKEDLLNGVLVASVSSVNKKIGQVTLNAADVGAEPIIEKASAFNKEFGNLEGTVCEGNDKRLSDSRNPLPHEHVGYIKATDINQAIENFLSENGITFSKDEDLKKVVTINNANLIVKYGEIVEE